PRAESPKAAKRSHLNPGFKVVSYASTWRRTFPFPAPRPLAVAGDPDEFRARLFSPHAPRTTPRGSAGRTPWCGGCAGRPTAVRIAARGRCTCRRLLGQRRRDRAARLADAASTRLHLLPAGPARGRP